MNVVLPLELPDKCLECAKFVRTAGAGEFECDAWSASENIDELNNSARRLRASSSAGEAIFTKLVGEAFALGISPGDKPKIYDDVIKGANECPGAVIAIDAQGEKTGESLGFAPVLSLGEEGVASGVQNKHAVWEWQPHIADPDAEPKVWGLIAKTGVAQHLGELKQGKEGADIIYVEKNNNLVTDAARELIIKVARTRRVAGT